jgi:hypothetical protein
MELVKNVVNNGPVIYPTDCNVWQSFLKYTGISTTLLCKTNCKALHDTFLLGYFYIFIEVSFS